MADFSVGDLQTPAKHFTASDEPAAFADLDAALEAALSAAQPALVTCDLLRGGSVSSFPIREQVPGALSPVIEFRAAHSRGQAVLVLKGSARPCVYVAAKIGGGTRWVAFDGLAQFYALTVADRNDQRNAWIKKLEQVKKADWPSNLSPARGRLTDLSSVALRLLLAWLGPRGSIPVADKPRGAVCNGVTSPVFRYPLVEPECYLRVISSREGWLESINAWDLNAGISVGPIQFNAQGGFVIKFLHVFRTVDPVLFSECFDALKWTTKQSGTDPVLVVGGTAPTELIGRDEDNERNVGYFQSGTAGKTKPNAAFRKDLTIRFRDAMVWPHVQQIILEISADWLQPGLDLLAQANYPAIDPKRPDRDVFVLKALLLSCYVRFSGSLSHLIKHLKPFATPRKKIEALRPVLLAPGEWPKFGNPKKKNDGRKKRKELARRVEAQRPAANAVWDTINRLANAAAPPAGAAAAGSPRVPTDARFLASAGLEAANVDEVILRRLAKDHDQELPMERLIALRNERYPQSHPRFWAIVDFDLHSAKPRMFVFDVVDERVSSYLCAHGIGSEGPTDDGYANKFSNESGSNASSLGIYRCAETYQSPKNGYSLRLDGLEDTNSNARSRLIVVHGADYVSAKFAKKYGRIGRSDGCPALDHQFAATVIDQLKQGSLLIHWKAP